MNKIFKMEHFENETSVGVHVMKSTNFKTTSHWHNHYEIDFCTGGDGYTVLNGKKYPCKKGTMSFLTLADVHEYSAREQFSFINLNFNLNILPYSSITELLSNFSGFVYQCNAEEYLKFENILNQIYREDTEKEIFYKNYLQNLMENFLIDIYRKQNFDTDGIIFPHTVQKIIYYINAHFKESISLEDVAKYAGTEYSNTGKYIKKYLNMSFKEYLADIRLKYAKNLLHNTDEAITDIAFYCGYTSVTYFISEFKKKYGASPEKYKLSEQ